MEIVANSYNCTSPQYVTKCATFFFWHGHVSRCEVRVHVTS